MCAAVWHAWQQHKHFQGAIATFPVYVVFASSGWFNCCTILSVLFIGLINILPNCIACNVKMSLKAFLVVSFE